jgi:outer membrane protein OmpA-like peptidoglycan-associated protein
MRLILSLAAAGMLYAQVPPPADQNPAPGDAPMPIYRVTVVSRTTRAVSYRNRSGWTKVDLKGTALAPQATGHADVNSRAGHIEVKADMHHLDSASKYGPEYLTYVLWAVTPEGRSNNIGEVMPDNNGNFHLDVTTELQAFALLVTAEPYFGVTRPSDVVVMENIIREDTVGKFEYVDAKYDLLQRGQYTLNVAPRDLHPIAMNLSKTPIELYEARNAVQIAQYARADQYASDVFQKAKDLLNQAENYELRKAGKKPVAMTSREAVQTAENARIIALKRQADEALDRERQAAADREAKARADAEEQARLKADEQQRRRLADEQRLAAERAQMNAEAASQEAQRQRAAADAARAQAEAERAQAEAAKAAALQAQQQLAQQAAQSDQRANEADRMRLKAEEDQRELRRQLLAQLNLILETRDSARGLIVNMSDVLFDTARYTLRPGAREKLAKISGIVLAHPGLKLDVEGHTDSVGGDEYNQKLSEQRATAVRDYLVLQGLNGDSVTSRGFGKTMPVADNSTAAGRQQNRRVELVVSGDVIGTPISPSASQR